MLGALTAIALVAVGIAGANVAFGERDSGAPTGQGPVVSAPPAPRSDQSDAPGSPNGAPVATDASAEPGLDEGAERLPLTVLNHSRRPKLAQRAADRFRAGGWPIAEVGNTRHAVLETTVFYGPGGEPAAQRLRREFPEVLAAAPRPPDLPGAGLTVVVTREFPG